jgi:hypothetical protein
LAACIVSILLFLLASASDNSGFFDRYYGWLLGLNAAVAVPCCCWWRFRCSACTPASARGKFGSKLMTPAGAAVCRHRRAAGLVIFFVSVQFVSHSIDSWFNVPVEEALESGINLSRAGLDRASASCGHGRRTADQLAEPPFGTERATLAIWSAVRHAERHHRRCGRGLVVSARASRSGNLSADLPTRDMMAKAKRTACTARPKAATSCAAI